MARLSPARALKFNEEMDAAREARIRGDSATAWSAFVAGVVGGIVYAGLSRVVSRPVMSLWILAPTLATIDSVFIAVLPFPAGSNPPIGVPIYGLIVPVRQAAALLGIGHFGEHHFPAASLAAVTAVHYVTAVAVALLVPWWAGRKTP